MLDFMDYVQTAFYRRCRWNVDNSYASLTTTSHNMLDFDLPSGMRLHVSSLSAPNFATSYTVASKGVVDGSLSFLYSSLGLRVASRSSDVPLTRLVRGYRHLQHLTSPHASSGDARGQNGNDDENDALLYGRIYLPSSTLEALYLRRISSTRLLRLNAVSHTSLPSGGTILAVLQADHGKYSTEYLYSTDSALLGVRGLYNFGHDPRLPHHQLSTSAPAHGRLSLGGEVYFSPLNKSGGLSTGLRFTTLPIHSAFPYTMSLTVNPLMGGLSSSYAVKAGPDLALCSRFDFNVYSYESDVVVGVEFWQRRHTPSPASWAERKLRPGWARHDDDVTGVLKARVDNRGRLALLWEGRFKELLLSLGAGLDLKNKERMVGRVGVDVSYSS